MGDNVGGGAVECEGKNLEVEVGVPTAEILNNISAMGEQLTTEMTVALLLPAGAVIKKASLIALITAMNNTANMQKIDIEVQARKSGDIFHTYFSEDDCMGLPNVDGATTSIVPVNDVKALVTATGSYGFRVSVNQSAANSVRYTTQYVLLIAYTLS